MSGSHILVVDDSPTVLRMVQSVLAQAGYDVVTATSGEEGIAAARTRCPDLILLDFVMPGMNGYQVCRELADSQELRGVPVVLMSSKGDEPGQLLSQAMRVAQCIAKPFSPEAIVSVVASQLAAPPRERSITPVTNPSLKPLPVRPSESPVPATLLDSEVVLEGSLAAVPLAEVLVLLESQFQTGILQVRRENAHAEIYFREGTIQFASGEGLGDDFLLGRYVLELGLMTREGFDHFLAMRTDQSEAAPPDRRLIGQQLIDGNYLSAEDLRQALGRQTSERIYEVLRWRSGRFSFRAVLNLGQLAEKSALGLRVDALLLEGFRRLDEWHLVEHTIEDLEAVFLPNESATATLAACQLEHAEAQVLTLVDGHNTVRDIARQTRLSNFEVCKVLYRLLSIKLIRRRVAPVAV